MEITIKICLDNKQIKDNRRMDNIKKHIKSKKPIEENLSDNDIENEGDLEWGEDTGSKGKRPV